MKRINSYLLPQRQGIIDVFLLDTLNAQVREGGAHVLVHVDGADSLLAALLAHQVVRVRPVGLLGGDAGDDHHGLAGVPHHLDGGEGLVVLAAAHPRDTAGTPTLALVPEPQALAGRLLHDLHVGALLRLLVHLWPQVGTWGGFRVEILLYCGQHFC